MLGLVILFAILAIIFAVSGFGLAAGVAWEGARILFWIFIALLILSFLGGLSSGWGWPWRRGPLP
jgi:uncharacterized membrane protein YtjA (UPF0391 family)